MLHQFELITFSENVKDLWSNKIKKNDKEIVKRMNIANPFLRLEQFTIFKQKKLLGIN